MWATGVAALLGSCNPLQLDEPPVLAGDFTDPVYPKTYGRVSVELSVDPSAAAGEAGKTDTKALYLEFYFKAPDGKYILCKEYENFASMPSVALFPVGQYIVVARTKEYDTDREYFRGQAEMTVSETSTVVGKINCLLLADEFADPVYPKVYGQVAPTIDLQLGSLFSVSRSTAAPDSKELSLYFYFKTADNQWLLCKHYERSAKLPKGVSFPVGQYRLVVRSHEAMADIMKEPYVHGEVQFSVAAGAPAVPSVVCTVRNAWVELQPTSAFGNAVKGWKARLTMRSLAAPSVTLTADSTLVRFVRPGTWDLRVEGTQKGDNQPFTYAKEIGALAGGDRALAALDATDRGTLGATIEAKVDITRRDHEIVFPDDETELGGGGYNPDPKPDPDPEPTDPKPTIVGEGLDVDQTKIIADADFDSEGNLKYTLKVVATAETGGIQKFEITIYSTHPTLAPETISSIFDGTTFDLANVVPGSNCETSLHNFGILERGKKIKGDESFTFDLTGFMGFLPTHPEPHEFTLKVTDGKGQTATKTVRIKRVIN